MTIAQLLTVAREGKVSDVHITTDSNPVFRVDGELKETQYALTQEEKNALILSMLSPEQQADFKSGKDVDFCYTIPPRARHRVNAYHQQNNYVAAIRIINDTTPTFDELQLPEIMRKLADEPRGLILVTGPTGSGKSTTLAAMIDYINSTKARHILTVEDPVEYVYSKKRSIIHQREVGVDVNSFAAALRSSLREDPDVILVGEMRDYETISAAVTAAETGHLVLSTLHTIGAADTIDRIIDVFPPHNQQQIRTQLASILKGVITQQLLPRASGKGRVASFEIMTGSDAVLNLIRENKCHQLNGTIQMSAKQGMITLDASLATLVKNGTVSLESALEKSRNKNDMMSFLQAPAAY